MEYKSKRKNMKEIEIKSRGSQNSLKGLKSDDKEFDWSTLQLMKGTQDDVIQCGYSNTKDPKSPKSIGKKEGKKDKKKLANPEPKRITRKKEAIVYTEEKAQDEAESEIIMSPSYRNTTMYGAVTKTNLQGPHTIPWIVINKFITSYPLDSLKKAVNLVRKVYKDEKDNNSQEINDIFDTLIENCRSSGRVKKKYDNSDKYKERVSKIIEYRRNVERLLNFATYATYYWGSRNVINDPNDPLLQGKGERAAGNYITGAIDLSGKQDIKEFLIKYILDGGIDLFSFHPSFSYFKNQDAYLNYLSAMIGLFFNVEDTKVKLCLQEYNPKNDIELNSTQKWMERIALELGATTIDEVFSSDKTLRW